MLRLAIVVVVILFSTISISGQSQRPSTFEEDVDAIIANLKESDKREITQTLEEDLIKFHFSLGMAIRNMQVNTKDSDNKQEYGRNNAHPDEVSEIFVRAIWKKLRSSMSQKDRKQLESMERVLREVIVPPFNTENLNVDPYNDTTTLAEVIKHIKNAVAASNDSIPKIKISVDTSVNSNKTIYYSQKDATPLHLFLLRLETRANINYEYNSMSVVITSKKT